MAWRHMDYRLRIVILVCAAITKLAGSQYQGYVTFNGLPVPGATITATREGKNSTCITNQQGFYFFPDLADGPWNIEVTMFGFAVTRRVVVVAPQSPATEWKLEMLPLNQMKAELQRPAASPPKTASPSAAQADSSAPSEMPQSSEEDLAQSAAAGFLINGSVNNGAASPFSQAAAFGNNRTGGKGLYNGMLGITVDNSVLDARPFSLTGSETPKSAYNRMTGLLALGGPLQIPHFFKNGPNFFLTYQWTRNNDATTRSALVPTSAERSGIFSGTVLDPSTGVPFPGNEIPQDRISPQAQALLRLYPLPNIANNSGYNYQIPLISPTHQDALQSRWNKTLSAKDQIYGHFAFESTRSDTPNLFGFLDTGDVLGINTGVNWTHRVNQRWFLNLGFQFSRLTSRTTPYFADSENVSGHAGILGNNQDPANWGPPTLTFSSGIATLSDAQNSVDRNQTSGISYSMQWNRGDHSITFGGDFRRQQWNALSQQNPRGTFTFTGSTTGSDFADFLIGIPTTSSIAYGNADKYFRDSVYDAYLEDDWRIKSGLSVNLGGRWEYAAPIKERYGRLVNLDIAPGFAATAPVTGQYPIGTLTGQHYPNSLIRPDKRNFAPRIGIAWRPQPASSLIIRAGYGIYYDTSVYQTLVTQMAQQPPLSNTLNVQNSAATPLTLANGFSASPSQSRNTFAIDPNFRIGYAQNWQFSAQRDLPGSLQMTATYLGIKGTRGIQDFLPNTYPAGAINLCPTCPSGFSYLTSNGNSTREAAQIQLRRRLHSGLAATLEYTFSKSIDNDAVLGGQGASATRGTATTQNTGDQGTQSQTEPSALAVAQNWLDLNAERALSTFDQRHAFTLRMQYTTGMGLSGGTLLSGRKGALLKAWTFATQITAGSGLPQTPVYFAPVEGTGVTGTLRPNYTGASLYAAPPGLNLNPAAYTVPLAGQWGNAGRNSITGPSRFTLDASMGRAFRVSDRLSLDLRIDATNAFNHVNFTAWNTTINNAQFGLPAATNEMRSLKTTLRLKF